jgi:hypothetical protein
MEVSGQLHAPAALPRGKVPRYSCDRRMCGPQSRSGRGGGEKNSQPPPEIEPPKLDRPARSPSVLGNMKVRSWGNLRWQNVHNRFCENLSFIQI